jgi:DNA invertase Pin-like site-specific DNA recombinase
MRQAYLGIMGVFNEMERSTSRERQLEGIRLAKLKGVYKGRKKINAPSNFKSLLKKYLLRSALRPYSLKDFLKESKLKTTTLYNFIRLYKDEVIEELKREEMNLRLKEE